MLKLLADAYLPCVHSVLGPASPEPSSRQIAVLAAARNSCTSMIDRAGDRAFGIAATTM